MISKEECQTALNRLNIETRIDCEAKEEQRIENEMNCQVLQQLIDEHFEETEVKVVKGKNNSDGFVCIDCYNKGISHFIYPDYVYCPYCARKIKK